ncbi:MAG: GNAT family N-acetyltransferase [Cyclobacteriaceae bacterium]
MATHNAKAAPFLYLDCLYLEEDYRGWGIGEAMIKKLQVIAKEKACVNMQWQTPVFNQGAIRFYKKIGDEVKDKARFSRNIS